MVEFSNKRICHIYMYTRICLHSIIQTRLINDTIVAFLDVYFVQSEKERKIQRFFISKSICRTVKTNRPKFEIFVFKYIQKKV